MKVFLSSTGRDLKAHREAAKKAIDGLDMQCVRMEDFHGPAVKIEDFDDKRVAECDLFVIILGLTHGTCPDGSDKSYTELEYHRAVQLAKPIFLFPVPEDFAVPGNLIESDVKRAAQRAFRERAVKGVIRNTFTSPEDLAQQIPQAIFSWKNSPERSVQPGPFVPLPPRPYFAHPYPLQENFTGRVSERRMLTGWLTSGRNVLSIQAIGGMGKSALTWVWVQKDLLGLPLPGSASDGGEDCRVPEAARPEGVLWWSFYEEGASFGAFARETFRYASEGHAAPESVYELLRGLVALLARKRLLLVLDGFERELRAYASLNAAYQGDSAPQEDDVRACIDSRAGDFLKWIASTPMLSRVLITTRLHPEELDGLAGCKPTGLSSLDPYDAVRFFHARDVKGTQAEIQEACEPYGYHPLALRLLAGLIAKDKRQPGDIRVAARYPVTEELKGKEKHHILQVAYDAMEQPKRDLLSRFSAFRSPMNYEALAALVPFGSEAEFGRALDELIDRGLLLFDKNQMRYDLHPIVRQYAYNRLTDKARVHARLRHYFAKVPVPDKLKSVEDLASVIERYHHTLRAGRRFEAFWLFRVRLTRRLYFRFGAYQTCIDLLRGLFPDGEDKLPRPEHTSHLLFALRPT